MRNQLPPRPILFIACVLILVLLFCAILYSVAGAEGITLTASWYSLASLKKEGTWKTSKGVMANGKLFNENALTCATRLFALGSRLCITNISNGKKVFVIVTDRIGKRFATKRIDLSKRAFSKIARLKQGITKVRVTLVN